MAIARTEAEDRGDASLEELVASVFSFQREGERRDPLGKHGRDLRI